MSIITCPCCDGTGGTTIDDPSSMEPAYVNSCSICHGMHYIDTVEFTRAMLTETTDVFEAAEMAARDTPESEDA